MTDTEKEKVITDAIQRLVKNKDLNLSIAKMQNSKCKSYFEVVLNYTIQGEERQQRFGFVDKWFDPNYFEFSWVKNLQIPTNLNDYQKVVLKLAYYFYNWYKLECN